MEETHGDTKDTVIATYNMQRENVLKPNGCNK